MEDEDATQAIKAELDSTWFHFPVSNRGNLDMTSPLGDAVVQVATDGDRIRLALTGADGMVTVTCAPGDGDLLRDLLNSAVADARKSRTGGAW